MYCWLIISFITGVVMLYIMRQGALRYGWVSVPKAPRYDQRRIPYLGGIGMWLTVFSIAWIAGVGQADYWRGLSLGGLVICVFGFLDDVVELAPGKKFFFQTIGVMVWMLCGGRFILHSFPEWVNYVLTFLWMILMINAINLLDIIDGLAGGISAIASLFFLVLALLYQQPEMMRYNSILLGGLIAFLVFNMPPAKLFMGDAGSQWLGFTLGFQTVFFSNAGPSFPEKGFFASFFILGVPLVDLVFVMILRSVKNRSVFLKSNDHFALQLFDKGISHKKILGIMYGASLFFSLIALWLLR